MHFQQIFIWPFEFGASLDVGQAAPSFLPNYLFCFKPLTVSIHRSQRISLAVAAPTLVCSRPKGMMA